MSANAPAHARREPPPRRRRAVAGLVAALALGLVGGAAYAYTTAGGRGTGLGVSGSSPQKVVVEAATGSVDNRLSPGGSGDLVLTLDNPNAFSLTLTAVEQHGAVAMTGGQGCTAVGAGVSVPAQDGLSLAVASGTHSVTVPDGVTMGASSASGCQGARFEIPVLVTVHQG